MKRAGLLPTLIALSAVVVLTSRCGDPANPDSGTGNDVPGTPPLMPAIQQALGVVGSVHEHKLMDRGGERIVYHPRWSTLTTVTDAGGRSREIYRQIYDYHGTKPREVVIGFRDVALALFDPNHRIRSVSIVTTEGQTWFFQETWPQPCTERCLPGNDTVPESSLMPSAPRLSAARVALAPFERARASVNTGPGNRSIAAERGQVTYHPGWSSRIRMRDAAGRSREIYRQARVHQGPHPKEVALGFRDVGLAVFDPNHRIRAVTVETLDGETWDFAEQAYRCPPDCPRADSILFPDARS